MSRCSLRSIVPIACLVLLGTAAHAVIGGRDVPDADPILRSFVGLEVQKTPRGPLDQCSGVLINDRHVLTAGHCLRPDLVGSGGVRVNAYFFGAARRITARRRARSTAVNPDFTAGRPGADLGLVILDSPVSPDFSPVANALDDVPLSPGTKVEVAGVGLTDFRNPSDDWRVKLGRLAYDNSVGTESWLKRGRDGVPCVGDSGGPAFVRDPVTKAIRLVGIQSEYTFYADTNRMTGAMIVHPSRYSAWITDVIGLDAPRPAGQNARGFYQAK